MSCAVWSRLQWRSAVVRGAARTLLRHLVDIAGTHSQRWTPRCTPSSVWQALLTPRSFPRLQRSYGLGVGCRVCSPCCRWVFFLSPSQGSSVLVGSPCLLLIPEYFNLFFHFQVQCHFMLLCCVFLPSFCFMGWKCMPEWV